MTSGSGWGLHRRLGPWPKERTEVAEAVAASVDVEDLDMMQEPVEDCRGENLVIGNDWTAPAVGALASP